MIVWLFLDAWIVKAVISHRSCATAMGRKKLRLGPPCSGRLLARTSTRLLRSGVRERSSLIEGPRCPMLGESLQHSARYEIKDFQGTLLS